MIAPTAIINGLGQSIGLFAPAVEGATGDYHSNYTNKINKAIELFKDQQANYSVNYLSPRPYADPRARIPPPPFLL